MPDPSEHAAVERPLSEEEAQELAEAIGVFATPSRLRLLWALVDLLSAFLASGLFAHVALRSRLCSRRHAATRP